MKARFQTLSLYRLPRIDARMSRMLQQNPGGTRPDNPGEEEHPWQVKFEIPRHKRTVNVAGGSSWEFKLRV